MSRIRRIVEQAWAAGFFDGEGCVSVSGRARRIMIGNTDPLLLYRFKEIVGVGSVKGPYYPKNSNASPFWRYNCSKGAELVSVFRDIGEFLSPEKQKQFGNMVKIIESTGMMANRCKKGHKFTPDNIVIRGNGRTCRICSQIYQKEYEKRRVRKKVVSHA